MTPLYEYQDESVSFKVLIIIVAIMFLVMAVFTPLEGDEPPWLVWGLKVLLLLLGIGIIPVTPTIRLRCYTDRIEVQYGPTKWITLKFDKSDIMDIYPIEYNPMMDFGGWGIKGGGGKWKGWWAYTATGSNKVLGIETTGRNYIVSCPDPEEASTILKNNLGIKSKTASSMPSGDA